MIGKLVVVVSAMLVASIANAEVEIKESAFGFAIKGEGYEAHVGHDGCLSSLKVHGREFLDARMPFARGSGFGDRYLQNLTPAKLAAPGELVAENKVAGIRYVFEPSSMKWTLRNKTPRDLQFAVTLAEDVTAVAFDGAVRKPIINGPTAASDWFCGPAKLSVTGGTRFRGPVVGSHQAWESQVAAKGERTLDFTIALATPEEVKKADEVQRPPQDAEITVLSPNEYQVFQRQTKQAGRMLISGRTAAAAQSVQVRLRGKSLTGELPDEWRSIPVIAATRQFSSVVEAPAGGWYDVDIKVTRADGTTIDKTIPKVGVGEVFVGAGQSNSTNSGQFKTTQTSGMVSSFSGENGRWQLANDPQPGVADRSQGGSFWPAFGDAMYAKYQVPIGVATTGFGGTSVNHWQPEQGLFKWFLTRVHQLGPMGFRAVLWHQGENDVQMPTDEYYNKLRNTILASRIQAGWDIPWFVAQVSYHNPGSPSFESTRTAQAKIWADGIALPGPDTDTLTGDSRDLDGKGIHFSPKGLKAHGEIWAEKVGVMLDPLVQ
ncbi:MAG TPA: sialate O-acetylesterase [Caulifigura sp.]|nr:sialate O-acetylesterase [Caulifigura sp.]